ncbi:MAG: hypothetical protein WDN00_15615 [Limisphaerales bacterium]
MELEIESGKIIKTTNIGILPVIRNRFAIVAAAFLLTAGFETKAANILVWTNIASGGWNTAANWSPNAVPGASDTVIITNSGVTVSLNDSTTVSAITLGTNGVPSVTLSLAGNTLTMNGPLTVNPSGSFTVDSGTLTGNTNAVLSGIIGWSGVSFLAGTLTLASNSTLNIINTNNHNLPNCTVTNYGTVTWSNGVIRGGNNTQIYNYGFWNVQSDQVMDAVYGGNFTFNNLGTFRKSGGTNTSQTAFANGAGFNQRAGVIDVQNGVNGLNLLLQSGGNFTGGYVTTNSLGKTYLAQDNFTINGTTTGTNVIQNAGSLINTNLIKGALTWVAGNWNGAASVTIATNTLLVIAGGAGVNDLPNCLVTNLGTVTWASGTIRSGNNAQIYNYGVWNAQSDQTINAVYGGNFTFNNLGTFRKSGGTNTSQTAFANGAGFNQRAGVIDVQNGVNGLNLLLQSGGNFTGGYVTTNSLGKTYLAQDNFTINGTTTGTNVIQNAGSLINTNLIKGALTWVAGNWNGAASVTIATNTLLVIAGGAGVNDLPNCLVTNLGTVTWASGTIRGGNNAQIYNYGVWNAQSDQTINAVYGGNFTFNNLGTFRKSGGSGGSSQIQSGIFFKNLGTLDCQSGDLSLQGVYSLTGGTLNFGLNNLTNYGTISLAGPAALTGTISVNLNNGYQPAGGSSFTNLFYSSFTGMFTNTLLPNVYSWTTNYNPTFFVLKVLNVLNVPPIFVAPTTNNFIVNELAVLNITNTATDADLPAQTLTYSLIAGTNGIVVNPTTGILTWTPQQTNSPSTNTVSVAVSDNGTPTLKATNTYTIVVREVNVPPTLPTVSTQTVNELTLLTVTNIATNSNIHSTITGYRLVNPPSGMSISTGGIITWTPTQVQSPGTNLITTVATNFNAFDLINPRLNSTNQFTVIVKEVNVASVLPVIPTQTITVVKPFSITNAATQPNIHSVTAGYRLLAPPAGAAISTNGVITWTPAQNYILTTNTITTVVTNSNPYDLVKPNLSTTNSFSVIVAPSTVATNLAMVNSGGTNLTLSWPADHTGWRIQIQTNTFTKGLGTNWVTLPGSTLTNKVIVPISTTNGSVFFRMTYP